MSALVRSALALLVLAAGPSGAAAATPAQVPLPPPPAGTVLTRPASPRTLFVGGKAGIASPLGNGGEGSPVLQVEVATPWRTTPSGVSLGWALVLRTSLPSTTSRFGMESGATGLDLTPTARASMPLGRSRWSFRTEAGLGVVSRWTWAEVDTRFLGRRTETGQETTGIVRMGLALDWAVRPGLALAVEPLSYGFDLRGNAEWIFAAGASYRL
jgi:hypothetical protein